MINPAISSWKYGDISLELGVPIWFLWLISVIGVSGIILISLGKTKPADEMCIIVIQVGPEQLRPNLHSEWVLTILPRLSAQLRSSNIPIHGIVIWDKPMPLDPRHNSKIVYKDVA